MARNTDHSGVPHTCPLIDSVIDFISNIDFNEEQKYFSREATKMVDILENIRTHNSNLRDFGNNMCKERDSIEDDNTDLTNKVSELESCIRDLKYELEKYEK